MSEYAFQASVELETAASQAALRRLVRSVDEVKESMGRMDVDPGIAKIQEAFKAGGPSAATKEFRNLETAMGSASLQANEARAAMTGLNAALEGDAYAVSMCVSRWGEFGAIVAAVIGSTVAIHSIIKRGTEAIYDQMEKIDSLTGYYRKWANEATNVAAIVTTQFEKVRKTSETAMARGSENMAGLTRNQARDERVRTVRDQLAQSNGTMTPEQGIERTRMAEIVNAEQRKAMAGQTVSSLQGQAASVAAKADEAKKNAESLRRAAYASQDLDTVNAYIAAKESAEKLANQAKDLSDRLVKAMDDQVAIIKDADAAIEVANAQAVIKKGEISKAAAEAARADQQKKAEGEKALVTAQGKVADEALSRRPAREQLAAADAKVEQTRQQIIGATSPAEKAKLIEEQLANVKKRDTIRQQMQDDQRTTAEAAKANAARLADAKAGLASLTSTRDRVSATNEDLFRDHYASKKGISPQSTDERMIDLLQRIAEANAEIVKLSGGVS